MTPLETLWYWVEERESLRKKKLAGKPKPWTTDHILQSWRFCNVRREDDTVTQWIDEHIREEFAHHENLWFMLCIARMINWPPTLQALMDTDFAWPDDEFDLKEFGIVINNLIRSGKKTFTGAYMIPAGNTKEPKGRYLARVSIGSLWKDRKIFRDHFAGEPTLQNTHEFLTGYDGWGNFLAYQAIVDMRFTRLLEFSPDVHTWAAAGPGTLRGLNRIHGRPLEKRISQEQALKEMRALDNMNPTRIKFDFSDIPNILCETDKYLRVKNNEGKPRSRYEGFP